jgi:Ion transport protein
MARSRATANQTEGLQNTAYEIFIGILSVLSIINLVLVLVFQGDEPLQLILSVMNGLFSVIFLGDFILRMRTAPSAAHYFFRGFGWADLLASLPFPQLKILRIFRLIRVYRLLQTVGPRKIWSTLVHDRANSALMTLLLMGVLVLQFGSLAMLGVEEHAEGANITSASDAIWYTIVTISTVGYGDQYPVTNAGRIIGALIIVIGVGIFGTFTGYLANVFLGPDRKADPAADTVPSAADDQPTRITPTAEHTAKGVAAGGTAGAVAAGADAPASEGATAGGAATDDVEARLRVLLAQSEQIAAELRSLVTAGGSGGM